MRAISATYGVVAAVLLCGSALAQNNTGPSAPRSSGSSQTTGQTNPGVNTGREAPVGHRQPRAKDLPPTLDENRGVRSPEDEAIDRKLRICRDC
jgi:hypothetical protein